MYSSQHAAMPPPQSRTVAPETFLLDENAHNSLPPESIVALQQVDNLKYFLLSAPVDWSPDQYIRRFLLPTGEYVSCVLWNNLFHISGTDIVRCLSFRFQAFGRPVKNSKKFEEGIFSDLRNLKSGTDASLEEPKSKFLDFLYKNNCIRTQKKQKVFYWYSVPHDRLFLDALERDLKREKMNQEATTVAVAEPALSFEFDSSQSLFEQLTKAQQTNSSSFNGSAQPSFSQSPSMRAVDSMPPPQMSMPMQAPMQIAPPVMQEEPLHQMSFAGMPMAGPIHPMIAKSREQDYMPRPMHQFTRDGVPLNQIQQRHSSMPVFMEYSPAPSLALSHYDDYSTRGMSFEPMTPPQSSMGMGSEPSYLGHEENGLYNPIPDLGVGASFNPMMQMPPTSVVGPQFNAMQRSFAPPNAYSVLEGSPTYKQRRRRSSISQGMAAVATHAAAAAPVHRPSDLRRSMSASVAPVAEVDEAPYTSPVSAVMVQPYMAEQKQHDASRHGTPLQTVEQSPVQHPVMAPHQPSHDELNQIVSPDALYADAKDFEGMPLQHSALARTAGVFRRARSATMMELGPYPQKSHSCPIPTCGRLFKRLEHLKRHVRTHTQERPYVCSLCSKAFSRSDNLAQHRRTHEQQNGEDGLPIEEPIEDFSEEDFAMPTSSDHAHDLASLMDDDQISPTSATEDHHSLPSAHSQTHHHWDSFQAPMQAPMQTGGNMHGPSMNGTIMAPPQMIAAHNY